MARKKKVFFSVFSIDLIDDDGPLTQLLCDSALPSTTTIAPFNSELSQQR
jgi:hypothetical protein